MFKKSALAHFGAIVAGSLMLISASSASAGLVGVTDIKITSAFPTWLQVTEVTALKTAGGDAASLSAGASATSFSQYNAFSNPSKAIDDTNAGGSHWLSTGEYHSGGTSAAQFLLITLSGPTELDSITIFGRGDCCSYRDVYNIVLLDDGGDILYEFDNLDARGVNHQVTINLPDTAPPPTTSVSEPGTLVFPRFCGHLE